MTKVSGHSGLREEIELKQMTEKYEKIKVKRRFQIDSIKAILSPMPECEKRAVLSQVIREITGL